jgi:GNAT superfamily N-acetyltransferase
MFVRRAKPTDKDAVLVMLDEFRADCIEQITGKPSGSHTAREGGTHIYESLLSRSDYCIFLLEDSISEIVGVLTGYLCPMLRSGEVRAEIEEFFVQKEFRGDGNAQKLMDAFFDWAKVHQALKVNLESDNELLRAHGFYKKYGFETKARRFVKNIDN